MGSIARGFRETRALAWTWVAALALVGSMLVAASAQAARTNPSLPAKEGSAPLPGPEILYAPPAQAPQLENAPGSGWKAKPILISGASAYSHGEFLYQGYVYDDHGAKEVLDPTNPMISPGGDASGGDTFSEPDGTYTYPTGAGYDENAANLIELRVRPKAKTTAFRITLNTLENPDLVATAIAIGGSEGETHPFPFGANVSAPAQYFLTVHGETATLTDAASGAEVAGPAPTVSVDLARRQITVEVAHKRVESGHLDRATRGRRGAVERVDGAAICCPEPRPARRSREAPEPTLRRPRSSTSRSASTTRSRSRERPARGTS